MSIANDAMGSDKYAAEANSALASSQYCAVKLDSTAPASSLHHLFAVILPSAGERPQFLVTEPGALNATVHVCGLIPGKQYIGRAGGAIARGDVLVVTAAGKFLSTGTSGDAIVGYALGPADGDGSLFSFIAVGTGTVG